jgi:two-component system, LuxR family, sensor kinase FixL
MSWITVVWSMASAVCVTLALIHLALWFKRRAQVAHLLFALTALGAAGSGLIELAMLKSVTVEGYVTGVRLSYIPLTVLLIAMAWYACTYFDTSRPILALAITVAWIMVLVVDAFVPFGLNFREISGLRVAQTPWGESFTLPKGVGSSPLHHILNVADLTLLVFVLDTSVTMWRRGNRGAAISVAVGICGAVIGVVVLARLTDAGVLQVPHILTFVYMVSIFIVGYPFNAEVLRAARLERQLQVSEAKLSETERRMTLAAEAAHLTLWEWDILRDEIWTTNEPRAREGVNNLERLDFNRFLQSLHPDDRDVVTNAMTKAVEGDGLYESKHRILLSNDRKRWIAARGRVEFDDDHRPIRMRGISMDITAQKDAEEKFRLTVEASPNGIILVDKEGHIVLVNSQTEKLFGYARGELIGHSIEILVPSRFRQGHPGYRHDFLSAPTARAMGAGRELYARRKDGTEFPVEIGLAPMETPEGLFILSAVVDISARKEAEMEAQRHRAELAHLSRVALMSEMSTSLAHELNQPLSGIVSNAAAGQRFIDRGDVTLEELREILTDIVSDGRRAGEVVRGIRSMVKKEQMVRQRLNLNEVVARVVQIVAPDALLRSCQLETSLEPSLPPIVGDPIQFQQVLLNLVLNAFDAMRDTPVKSRKVTIATEWNGDGAIRTSVRDHGDGIPAHARDHIFDPFFTTKEEGLGMGLAIVRSIVESYGGTMAADNPVDGGARFYFTLPANAAASA